MRTEQNRTKRIRVTWISLGIVALSAMASVGRADAYPRAAWVADLRPGSHMSRGLATVVDERTIQVDHFTYDGGAPAVYFYLGESNTHAAFVDGIPIGPHLDRAYSDETVVVQLPMGQTLDGYGAISVWCAEFEANFTSASFQCPGDLTGDHQVGIADIAELLGNYGATSHVKYVDGDLNGDGAVELDDLAALLAVYAVPCNPRLDMNFVGLEDLGSDYVYEGWLIVDGAPVSTGRFSIDGNGEPTPPWFYVYYDDAADATAFVLTIEPAVGDDPAPAATHVLAGDWDGQGADLTIGHPAALGDDFSMAAGDFILATPTTASDPNDYDQGIWWLDPAGGPAASLTLPTLPAGWAYEGWVVGMGGPISTGRFLTPAGADDDGAGPAAGPDGAPPFPGQDFINPPEYLIGYAAVISVEPEPDNSPGPFAIKPLVDTDIQDVGMGVLQAMANNSASSPSGTISLSMN